MQGPRAVGEDVSWVAARSPTLWPATHTSSFALGSGEVLLVEPATPFEDEQREWLLWARALRACGRELVGIFVTHHHPDHVGGAGVLARELGLGLWAHAATARRLPEAPAPVRPCQDGETIVLAGPRPQRWRVLHTPGHAPGHLCLYEPELGIGIVGDMVASEGTVLIAPGEGDLGEYLRQLERLAALELKLALPAHGGPIAAPGALFAHYVAHRRRREGKVLGALAAAGEAGAELAALLPYAYDDTPKAQWALARLSLESHLLELERQGRASRSGARWRLRSEPVVV